MRNNKKLSILKYILTVYIALGLVFSDILGISYGILDDSGTPAYLANPVIYKKQSVTSLGYYYSIYGLVVNLIFWSIFLYLIDLFVIKMKLSSTLKKIYKTFIILALFVSSFYIFISFAFMPNGFEKDLTYWYWNLDDSLLR